MTPTMKEGPEIRAFPFSDTGPSCARAASSSHFPDTVWKIRRARLIEQVAKVAGAIRHERIAEFPRGAIRGKPFPSPVIRLSPPPIGEERERPEFLLD